MTGAGRTELPQLRVRGIGGAAALEPGRHRSERDALRPIGRGGGMAGDRAILADARLGPRAEHDAFARHCRCPRRPRVAQVRDDDWLVVFARRQQAERRLGGGAVQEQVQRRHVGDNVIERAQPRRLRQIVAVVHADQRRIGRDPLGGQQRLQQRGVVFAIAPTLREHRLGIPRHDATLAEEGRHIAISVAT